MHFETFGAARLYRPSHSSQVSIRLQAEAEVRRKHAPGEYRDRDQINAIIHTYYAYYDEKIKRVVPPLASRHFMEFVLTQYDIATDIDDCSKRGELNAIETERWKTLGRVFRRAAKYVAECVCMLSPDEAPQASPDELETLNDECWICAEQMIELANLSTQTYALFPEQTTLEIRPPGEAEWIVLTVENATIFEQFGERVRKDAATRNIYINDNEFIYNRERVAAQLDNPFKVSCGFSTTDALSFGFSLNANAAPTVSGFDIPFVSENQIISSITDNGKITENDAFRLLDGICLRKAKMAEEGRVAWNPKQEYRAFTRPYFEFPHATGRHYIWSRRMAEECIMMLYTRLAQKQAPVEWRLGKVPHALEEYVNSITASFEAKVNDSLGSQGIFSLRFKSRIGTGIHSIEIPQDVGELDTLAYWPKNQLLIVGEAKLVKPVHEPVMFRDDVDKFIGKKKSYVEQLKRKTEWTLANANLIARALSSVAGFPSSVSVTHVAPALITYYPAFASCLITDIPCVSLSELMTSIGASMSWPYQPIYEV